jgi:glycosyltransferase involved in cell wall biosynthesis
MRACTGVQNKILEALAAGTPVVTTTMGAEGLDPAHLVIADTAREFARATLDLMADADRRRELSRAGRAWVETHSTWDAALTELDAALDQILQNASPRPLN